MILPDKVSISEMESYGYKYDSRNKMLPIFKEKALELFNENIPVYLLFEDDSESLTHDEADIIEHFEKGYALAGIEELDWDCYCYINSFEKIDSKTINMKQKIDKVFNDLLIDLLIDACNENSIAKVNVNISPEQALDLSKIKDDIYQFLCSLISQTNKE